MTRVLGCLLMLMLSAVAARASEPGGSPSVAGGQALSGSNPADAKTTDTARTEFVGLRVGFADRYKAGVWTPVEVTLRGGAQRQAGQVRLTVADGDGVPSRVVTPPDEPCVVLPGRTATQRLYVRFGRIHSTLTAEFVVEGRVAARREFEAGIEAGAVRFLPAMPALQPLIVSVGEAEVDHSVALRRGESAREDVTAHLPDCGQLPDRWYGYEGVEAVVLSTSRPGLWDDLTPTDDRVEALDRWVRLGGRLVFCVGRSGEEMLAPGAPLARFAPGTLAEMVSLRRLAALETYAGGTAPAADPQRPEPLRVPRLVEVRGVVEAREADLPLVVRTARGFGQVLFVAADLDQPPLSRWKDRPRLLAKLLDLPATRRDDQEQDFAVMRYGYDDLSGQLRGALDQFEGVRVVPFGLVAAAIVVYIAMIGPGDYFLLKRVLRRMELTWITFPAAVVAVSLAAYAAAHWLKGDELRMNQAEVVDVDVATGRVRGTAWFNLFSPRVDAFDLALAPRPPFDLGGAAATEGRGPESLMGWLGLPGRALGGMNPRAQGPLLWTDAYSFTPGLSAMRDVPIQAWSTKSFTARWQAAAPETLAADLAEVDDAPAGTIRNLLDVALTDCLLAYRGWAYRLGELAPGETFLLTAHAPRSELRTVLTGRRYVQEEKTLRQRITPYDRASVDPDYILNIMLFHEAAGGSRYTDLSNAYQPFIDFSSLLKADRAILVGRIEHDGRARPAAEILRGGEPIAGPDDRTTSIYRFVLPVEGNGGSAGP